jgi:hypothetical protein
VSYCADFPEDKQLIIHRLNRHDYTDEIDRLRSRRHEFLKLVNEILFKIK